MKSKENNHSRRARCGETCTAGSVGGVWKRAVGNAPCSYPTERCTSGSEERVGKRVEGQRALLLSYPKNIPCIPGSNRVDARRPP